MSKKKLNLKDLEVSSFVTTMDANIEFTIQGGARGENGSVNTVDVCYANTFNPVSCVSGTPPEPAPTVVAYCYTVVGGKAC